ncbi:MAG: hypothetical protein JWP34_2532 [Massilia sp.]|nr:hypothetical protein [Massilia sp.]
MLSANGTAFVWNSGLGAVPECSTVSTDGPLGNATELGSHAGIGFEMARRTAAFASLTLLTNAAFAVPEYVEVS